jgi:hypothetical protein
MERPLVEAILRTTAEAWHEAERRHREALQVAKESLLEMTELELILKKSAKA